MRPPKYKTAKELYDKAIEYLENPPVKTMYSAKGNAYHVPVPTITGLCRTLGFASRQSFYDLERNKTFSYTIKVLRLWIEQHYEENLLAGNTTGAIFALKNFGWTDKMEQDITYSEKQITGTEFIYETKSKAKQETN